MPSKIYLFFLLFSLVFSTSVNAMLYTHDLIKESLLTKEIDINQLQERMKIHHPVKFMSCKKGGPYMLEYWKAGKKQHDFCIQISLQDLEQLVPEELIAAIGHEFAHIAIANGYRNKQRLCFFGALGSIGYALCCSSCSIYGKCLLTIISFVSLLLGNAWFKRQEEYQADELSVLKLNCGKGAIKLLKRRIKENNHPSDVGPIFQRYQTTLLTWRLAHVKALVAKMEKKGSQK